MTAVKDKDIYTIDLRPYFIDLRRDFAVADNMVKNVVEEVKNDKVKVVRKVSGVKNKEIKNVKKDKSFVRGVLEYAAYAVIFVMLVWGTPLAMTRLLNSDQPIASITSSSMWPVLKRGDIVFIKGVSGKDDIKMHDIVVFDNGRGFTIHRVVKLKESTLITRGDANNLDDAPVKYEQVVGKAVTWSNGNVVNIPQIGKFSETVQKVKGRITKTVSASWP